MIDLPEPMKAVDAGFGAVNWAASVCFNLAATWNDDEDCLYDWEQEEAIFSDYQLDKEHEMMVERLGALNVSAIWKEAVRLARELRGRGTAR